MKGERNPERIPDADRREKYLADLETIRALMTRYEEQSLVRPWVFLIWGILVIPAAFLSRSMTTAGRMTVSETFLSIWVPVLVIGGILETVGWFQHARIAGTALVSGRMSRLLLTAAGVIVLVVILVVAMLPVGPSPAVVLAIAASPILMYALMTYASLFLEAYLLLASAAALMILESAGGVVPFGAVEAGVLAGVTFVVVGIHTALAEQKRRAKTPDGA
jgi:hypothetical protein